MGIRMTGLISGMDTETIIKQLVDAQKMKNKRTTDKRDLLTFKQEKWKDLNTKLFKLYQNDLSELRFQKNFNSKNVTSSNEDVISAIANGSTVPEGTHTIEVTQTAVPQYLTGKSLSGKLSLADGTPITGNSKLVKDLGMSATGIIAVETKDGVKQFEIDENTTLFTFANQLRGAGISANYDEAQGRFFLGSKTSGEENYFAISTFDDPTIADRRKIHEIVGFSGLSAVDQKKVTDAYTALRGTNPTDKTNAINFLNGLASDKVKADAKNIATNRTCDEVKAAFKSGGTYAGTDYSTVITNLTDSLKADMRLKYGDPSLDFTNPQYAKELSDLIDVEARREADRTVIGTAAAPPSLAITNIIQSKQDDIVLNGTTLTDTAADGTVTTTVIKSESQVLSELQNHMTDYAGGSAASVTGQLGMIGLTEVTATRDSAGKVTTSAADTSVTLSQAKNTEIKYNGTPLESDSNVITINGLTITIKGTTAVGEKISLNVTNNAQGTYDMIKNFVKSYNSILTEMNSLYYAPSSRGYDPLSDEEREAMTDDQVKKWEGKITDSILRRDDTVGSILSTMKMATNTSVEVNGKKYSLASFGIQTGVDYTEKGILHILGDKEDTVYGSQDDKLMKAINEDPELVAKVFTNIAQNMWEDLGDKCKGISNVRSAGKFYNDKEMDKVQDKYKKEIKVLEKKLTAMEDKYYKQFAAMESALAKMQSQTNSLAGMLGQ